MSGRHTPGPWFVMPNGIYVGDKKVWFDQNGARCGETPNIIIDCPSEADANLISAAPEMLIALERLLDATVEADLAHGIELTEEEREARAQALAALAKARGVA